MRKKDNLQPCDVLGNPIPEHFCSADNHLWHLCKHIAHICLWFNGIYYPGSKNIHHHLSRCKLLPDNCYERLVEIISNPNPVYAFQNWLSIAHEMTNLISSILPEGNADIVMKELEWIGNWDWIP